MMNNAEDTLLTEEIHEDEKRVKIGFIVIGIVLVILLTTVSYLIYLTVDQQKFSNASQKQAATTFTTTSPSGSVPSLAPQATSTPSSVPVVEQVVIKESSSSVKEYFIPFGTGSSSSNEWTDVPGVQTAVDFGNYPNIKEVRFEVTINIPGSSQIVNIRLFNVTDKHSVWFSDVTTTTNNAYVVSEPIVYDTGNKIYKVQIKTQLGYAANLTQARIHVTLK